ncbi:hypothetical protein KAU19_00415 [Candidatus Parcubacteria bacterium]|nr:hypothetical protein [Candidatus Parcubacteria bacterium]
MKTFLKQTKRKINGVIWTLISTGIILLLLGVLIVWYDFVLRLIIGLVVIVVAYVFFYVAYKIWALKKEVEKYFKF